MKIGTAYYYYHNDHIGTPQKMTSVSGAVVWSTKYSSFGEASIEVESVTNNLRFPGQYWDGESGLHYNWWRYYSPENGKYLTVDPIGINKDNNHLYNYCANNPASNIDPEGLKCGSGWTDPIVPDCPWGYNFTPACEWHDRCYEGKFGDVRKKSCDEEFHTRMKNICNKETSPFAKSQCNGTADTYYGAVATLGLPPFCKARKENGFCSRECR